MSDQTIYSGALSIDGRPIAEGGASGAGGTYAIRMAGLAPALSAYAARVLALSPIAYYQLNGDASDSSGNDYDGTATGATFGAAGIGDGNTAALFSAAGHVIDIAAMAGAFDADEGSIVLWAKVSAVGLWTDGAIHNLLGILSGSGDRVSLQKTTTNNTLLFRRVGAGTPKSVTSTALGGVTDWTSLGITWSLGGGSLKAYINGVQIGTTQTGLEAFEGALTGVEIGNFPSTTAAWSGTLAHVAIFGRALSGAEMLSLGVL